jgi:hypothetical protein
VEPNNDLAHAQPIELPVIVDGVVESADYDVFRFHAEAGQDLVFDLLARRAGSRLDGTLGILDNRGNELDFNDDYYIHKDPHLEFRVPKAGDYIRVSGSNEEGSQYSAYRLIAGAVPYVHRLLPAGCGAAPPTNCASLALTSGASIGPSPTARRRRARRSQRRPDLRGPRQRGLPDPRLRLRGAGARLHGQAGDSPHHAYPGFRSARAVRHARTISIACPARRPAGLRRTASPSSQRAQNFFSFEVSAESASPRCGFHETGLSG